MAAKSSRIAIALSTAVALMAVAVPAHAAKVVKPPVPIIVKMDASSAVKGLSKIRVQIEKAPAGVTSTIVTSNNGKQCTIKKTATSCTLSKVPTKYNVSVRARAMKGTVKGSLSPWLSIRPSSTWIREGYNSLGVKFPSPTNSSANGRIIGNSAKWTKFQALKRSGVTSAGLRQAKVAVDSGTVVFQMSGAVALALSSASGSCGSNYAGQSNCAVAVAADGSTPSLFAPGSPTPAVRDFYSALNGKIYVVFMSPTSLTTNAPTCPLAEVNVDTGIPTCVDAEMSTISTTFGSMYGQSSNGNASLQFDGSGNLYYAGTAKNSTTFTLRRNAGGVITRIVNDNVMIRDFLVMNDGSVLISGTTTSTNAAWVRKVSPSGAITTLSSGSQASFLRKFADGNAYMGVLNYGATQASSGVIRYNQSTGALDAVPWMAGGTNYYNSTTPSQNQLSGLCSMSMGPISAMQNVFCSSSGANVVNAFNFGTTQTIAIVGGMGMQVTRLMQYYPTVRDENTIVKNITIGYQVAGKLLLTGLDVNNKNVVTVYNPATQLETVIYDGSNEIEIYSIGYVASTGKIMFNGLSFATGQVVVGDIVIP
jgi:hypothetical protein